MGGEKVYPDEVEKIIETFENVADVTVYGEKNPDSRKYCMCKNNIKN